MDYETMSCLTEEITEQINRSATLIAAAILLLKPEAQSPAEALKLVRAIETERKLHR